MMTSQQRGDELLAEHQAQRRVSLTQLIAASALITKLERIASSGVLSVEDEIDAREIIVKAAKVFQFDTLAERPISNVMHIVDNDPEYLRTIENVTREMGT